MKPPAHAIASFSAALILWFFTKSIYAAALCFFSGFLVDLDHFLEFFIHFGAKGLSFRKVYKACENMVFKKLYLFFHVAEFAIILWVFYYFTKNIYVLAAAIGLTLHLILDFTGNPLHFKSYFFTRRFMRGFEIEWKKLR